MTDSMRDRIERELGKDRLHELDKPVFGGRQLSDKQIEEIADALLEAFPWLADEPTDAEVEAGARALHDRLNDERGGTLTFGELPPTSQELLRGDARTVLEAVIGKEQDSGQ